MDVITCTAPVNLAVIKYCKFIMVYILSILGKCDWIILQVNAILNLTIFMLF
jgi:hypothetical protein